MKSTRDCTCLAVRERLEASPGRPLVILTSKEVRRVVQSMVAISLPEDSICTGSTWSTPTGHRFSVRAYEDDLPGFPSGFDLHVCNGGRPGTDQERREMKKWRDASK